MPKFFINDRQINQDEITITGGDVNHIVNVLRMKQNDNIQICNLDSGINYLSKIQYYNKEKVVCKLEKILEDNSESKVSITLFQGIPKFDKMEWIIQKNTEIGIKEFIPVNMVRCIAKIKDSNKIERWNKIAEIAAKQSMRNVVPKVQSPKSVHEMCNMLESFHMVLVAYEMEKDNTLKGSLKDMQLKLVNDKIKLEDYRIGILIGPEGGIDKKEIEEIARNDNVKVITLGKRILRTETAGLVLASNILYELDS